MDGSSASRYVTAPTTPIGYSTTSASPLSDPAHSGSTMKGTESGKRKNVEEEIEHSKSHWSEVVTLDSNITDDEQVADNMEVFKTLQMHPTWRHFFCTFGYDLGIWKSDGELEVGEKFAEGGQAELYHAQVKWWNPEWDKRDLSKGIEWVLKVFKKSTSLRHLQSQWPHGYLQFRSELYSPRHSKSPLRRYFCDVKYGTLLKDGRFAFLMQREHEDLRHLINRKMLEIGQGQGPFSKADAEWIMWHVAKGMDWLHSWNIVHRDLKASNVLGKDYGDGRYDIYVADYECSLGTIGTGFWRAPEILQAIKDKKISERPEAFSKKADVYAYGMTCYEILTGELPFGGHSRNDYNLVLNGQRPKVPQYVDDWLCDLVMRCWEQNPTNRPSFREILDLLACNSARVREAMKHNEE